MGTSLTAPGEPLGYSGTNLGSSFSALAMKRCRRASASASVSPGLIGVTKRTRAAIAAAAGQAVPDHAELGLVVVGHALAALFEPVIDQLLRHAFLDHCPVHQLIFTDSAAGRWSAADRCAGWSGVDPAPQVDLITG